MAKRRDRSYLTGTKIGRWTFIKSAKYEDRKTYIYESWLCKCDCGTEREVYIYAILKGKSISCGCYNIEVVKKLKNHWLKDPGESCRNHLILVYKKGAFKRNLEYKLTIEDFEKLTKQNCFYCNIEPKQLTGRTKYSNTNGDYIYNGIDRVDNNKGYILENCVACCKNCNRAKRVMTQEDFLNWVSRIYNNLKQKDLIRG